jgi:hypothetical protein
MKKSPYNGKEVGIFEIHTMYNVLKFYYDELEDLPLDAVTDIIRTEFGCKITRNDVYLYLILAPHWDNDGNLISNE